MPNEKRLIDANALIHRVVAERDSVEIKTGCDIGYHNGLNMAVSMAINAPAVDAVEVVHGRWECEHETWGQLQCSNCKKQALLEKSNGDVGTILLYVTSNYCPNCGAKMDGENR